MLAALIALASQVNAPFAPTNESLGHFQAPEWFRDAKFGIWAHWGPQSVPKDGDWYARNLYQEGSEQYKNHLEHFGHPSKTGYKDIIPLWKAEKWDPAKLMKLYKRAGARYFVSMGAHHDNFDLWNSKYHTYNAVNMGPKRDVVGTWQKEAKKNGMRFGVSEHLGASWNWFQMAHGADKTGEYAGIPYDGNDPRYEELYHPKALPGDNGWYTTDPRWHKEWSLRVHDLIQSYHPDLLYSDGGVPFGQVGRQLVTDFYNQTVREGKTEAVYLAKGYDGGYPEGSFVLDHERGVAAGISPYPWQTDTSIGDWFYKPSWTYRKADWVIRTLVDVVSKNGNLLINMVQRPDGELDPEVYQLLDDMAGWMRVNSESIYSTRPWLVFGEGPARVRGGSFNEDFGFSGKDVRYVRKGNKTIYATFLGKPEAKVVLRCLALFPSVKATIKDVRLLGSKSPVAWNATGDGLNVDLPQDRLSPFANVLKITVSDADGFRPDLVPAPAKPIVRVQPDGTYAFGEDIADTKGGVHTEERGGRTNFGFWDNADDRISWPLEVKTEATLTPVCETATINGDTSVALEIAPENGDVIRKVAPVVGTGDWGKFVPVRFEAIHLTPGKYTVRLGAADKETWKGINLRGLRLVP